jgi:hypothetical protein
LLEDEEGVCARCAGDFPGDRDWLRGIDPGSGVESVAVRFAECCLEGGWSDFAFTVRGAFALAIGSFGTPVVVFAGLKLEVRVSRRLPLFRDGDRPIGSCELSPANLDIPS